MKIIKYNRCDKINHGTEENPQIENFLSPVEIRCNEDMLKANEEIAKKEAYNGEYEIIDDGQPEPIAEPSTDNILNALLGV